MSAVRKIGNLTPSPGGKPAKHRGWSIAEYIGRATKNGQDMASFMVRVMKGIEKNSEMSHRMRATEWLADRFAGKAVEVMVTGEIDSASNPLAELNADELRALIHKIVPTAKAKAGAAVAVDVAEADMNVAVVAEADMNVAVAQPAETTQVDAPKPTGAE